MSKQIPSHQMIETFRAAILNGGIGAGADALGISQSSASRTIADLQKLVGFQLFAKHGRTVRPTDEALALMAKVQQSFLGLEDIANFSEQLRKRLTGRLSIAAIPAIGYSFMPDAVKFLHSKHPDVVVKLDILSSMEVVRAVVNRQSDIGFGAHRLAMGEVEYLQEFTADCLCISEPGGLDKEQRYIELEQLVGKPFIAVTGSIQKRLERLLGEAASELHTVAETSQSLTASELAMRGTGIAVVDPFTAALHKQRGGEALPLQPGLPFSVQALALGDTRLGAPARDLLQYVTKATANMSKQPA